ncbi:MAG: PSD1 domain-containing protein [Verrucomicrobia bacterium]|nr:PSD1 domain-containing protein [Verrucomicrobiota bacterium]
MPRPTALAAFLLLASIARAASADGEALFAQRVWPILSEKCLACHGKDEAKIKGGLDLRTRAAALEGGDSTLPAFVTGKPDDSPLYHAITRAHPDWEPMPPKENDALTDEQIDGIKQWIAAGAPWLGAGKLASAKSAAPWSAADGVTVGTSGGLSSEWSSRRYKPEDLWAYRPLRKPAPPAGSTANPIDAFINAKLTATQLAPAPLTDPRTFIRRITFDLTGLPPTPEEIAAFERDSIAHPHSAVGNLVDRLLASPHYGERWARHWLDVVRYADTSGFANDFARGSAWRYRDYVVRAFNSDKPYDQFIREQIAGDELAESSQPSTLNSELLVATGFLRMGPWELTGMEVPKVARQRFLDDVTQTVGETFLAHPLQCARCHDHKFDPVPTRDYYAMQAVFSTTQLSERPAPFAPGENTTGFEEKKYLEQRRQHYLAILRRLDEKSLAAAETWFAEKKIDRTPWDAAVTFARQQERGGAAARREFVGVFAAARTRIGRTAAESDYPPKLHGFTPEDYGHERIARKGLERIRWELDRYEPFAFAVYSGRTPEVKNVLAPQRMPAARMTEGELEQPAVLAGGDPFSPGEKVAPGVLSAVTALGAPELGGVSFPAEIAGRRRALAEWIASPQNPLTARTMVNRVWLWHFGRALAGNPNNFGANGKKPTHPELLDWLAATFIEQGWSVKALHRLILTSDAYRRSTQHPDLAALATKDPEGTSYAVFRPRRLDADELRDAMLAVSGELNPALGGIPVRPAMNAEAAHQPRQVMGTFAEAWQPSPLPAQRNRRSLYALRIRGQPDPFAEVFNAPNPDLSCEGRDASTVTPQVFALFNSEASHARALAFAARAIRETTSREAALARAFALAFGRAPTAAEARATLAHWDAQTARHRSLTPARPSIPREVRREAAEENTGEKFTFTEPLEATADYVPDLAPPDVPPETRALADVCLVLLNANEFAYVY